MSDAPRLLRVADVAVLLNCSRVSVYRAAELRKIPCFRLPGIGLRFDPEEIQAWLESQRNMTGPRDRGASSSPRLRPRPRAAGLTGENLGADG